MRDPVTATYPGNAATLRTALRPTGPAAAAALGAGLGAVFLGGGSLLASVMPLFERGLADASRLLMPGGEHLGTFGGQQVVAAIAWLLSWAVLHVRWRRRQVSLTATALLLAGCVVVAAVLAWPPVARALLVLLGRR